MVWVQSSTSFLVIENNPIIESPSWNSSFKVIFAVSWSRSSTHIWIPLLKSPSDYSHPVCTLWKPPVIMTHFLFSIRAMEAYIGTPSIERLSVHQQLEWIWWMNSYLITSEWCNTAFLPYFTFGDRTEVVLTIFEQILIPIVFGKGYPMPCISWCCVGPNHIFDWITLFW